MSWLKDRRRWRHCPHHHVRGIYGDEANHTPGYRRAQCMDCGNYLDGPVFDRELDVWWKETLRTAPPKPSRSP